VSVRPRVGVVLLNWNGRVHLERCLPTLLDDCSENDFVVVVDNHSHDDSCEWMRSNFPTVELLRLPENLRFAGGNNAGAVRAAELGAEIVVCINNDTRVEPGLLLALAAPFANDETVGVVGVRIVYDDRPDTIWYGGGHCDLRWGWTSHRALRVPVAAGRDPEGETGWVTGCCLAVRTELWQQLGGLDDRYYIYAEDVDFCLRARNAGWKLRYAPRGVLRHAVSASVGGNASAFKCYHKTRSRWELFARHGQGVLWPLGVLLQDLVQVFRAVTSRSWPAAWAVAQAWWDGGPGRRTSVRYSTEELLP
jgi:GT2 family glycosyltransferase